MSIKKYKKILLQRLTIFKFRGTQERKQTVSLPLHPPPSSSGRVSRLLHSGVRMPQSVHGFRIPIKSLPNFGSCLKFLQNFRTLSEIFLVTKKELNCRSICGQCNVRMLLVTETWMHGKLHHRDYKPRSWREGEHLRGRHVASWRVWVWLGGAFAIWQSLCGDTWKGRLWRGSPRVAPGWIAWLGFVRLGVGTVR